MTKEKLDEPTTERELWYLEKHMHILADKLGAIIKYLLDDGDKFKLREEYYNNIIVKWGEIYGDKAY